MAEQSAGGNYEPFAIVHVPEGRNVNPAVSRLAFDVATGVVAETTAYMTDPPIAWAEAVVSSGPDACMANLPTDRTIPLLAVHYPMRQPPETPARAYVAVDRRDLERATFSDDESLATHVAHRLLGIFKGSGVRDMHPGDAQMFRGGPRNPLPDEQFIDALVRYNKERPRGVRTVHDFLGELSVTANCMLGAVTGGRLPSVWLEVGVQRLPAGLHIATVLPDSAPASQH